MAIEQSLEHGMMGEIIESPEELDQAFDKLYRLLQAQKKSGIGLDEKLDIEVDAARIQLQEISRKHYHAERDDSFRHDTQFELTKAFQSVEKKPNTLEMEEATNTVREALIASAKRKAGGRIEPGPHDQDDAMMQHVHHEMDKQGFNAERGSWEDKEQEKLIDSIQDNIYLVAALADQITDMCSSHMPNDIRNHYVHHILETTDLLYLKIKRALLIPEKGEFNRMFDKEQWKKARKGAVDGIAAEVQEANTYLERLKSRLEREYDINADDDDMPSL